MIKRDNYLDIIKRFKDIDLIKVVTGIRRCGKSTLLLMYIQYLLKNNIDNIIHIDLEDSSYRFITDYIELEKYIRSKVIPNEKNYVFVDEIQIISKFEVACSSLYFDKDIDLYITGSNAYLLSNDIATLLSGRCAEIKMMPLSFKEYSSVYQDIYSVINYNNYISKGSFPLLLKFDNIQDRNIYLDNIYNSIIVKDISIRKPSIDIIRLNNITKYLFDNIGNLTNSLKIANTLTSAGNKISSSTVDEYIQSLIDCYVIYKAERYDVKGKKYLSSGFKYYVCDIGLRQYLLGDKNVDYGHILENIVFLELIRRGYEVYVGKLGDLEIDFIAIDMHKNIEYYQVAYTAIEKDTLNRELESLNKINDSYPKYLLTMDNVPKSNHNGIKQLFVLDWLLDNG